MTTRGDYYFVFFFSFFYRSASAKSYVSLRDEDGRKKKNFFLCVCVCLISSRVHASKTVFYTTRIEVGQRATQDFSASRSVCCNAVESTSRTTARRVLGIAEEKLYERILVEIRVPKHYEKYVSREILRRLSQHLKSAFVFQ